MKRKKTYTRQFNRKLKELNSYKNKLVKIIKIVNVSQQIIDTADAGLNVMIKREISANELLDILRG